MNYAKTSILYASILSLLLAPVMLEDAFAAERIPTFMKTNIEWYATGQISEGEFINALTYLMNTDVIVLDQGKADTIKELRDENKALRDAMQKKMGSGVKIGGLTNGIPQYSQEQQQPQQEQKVSTPSRKQTSDTLDVGFYRVTD